MAHCMALWCKNKGQIPGISYFKLTKNRHDEWMKALGRNPNIEHLSPSNLVCSEHFTEEHKIYKNKCLRLKSDAVPTLKLRKRDEISFGNRRNLESSADQPSGMTKEPRSMIVEEEEEPRQKIMVGVPQGDVSSMSADHLSGMTKEPPSMIKEGEEEEPRKKSWLVCRRDLF